jgi:hypothetical protein
MDTDAFEERMYERALAAAREEYSVASAPATRETIAKNAVES